MARGVIMAIFWDLVIGILIIIWNNIENMYILLNIHACIQLKILIIILLNLR